MRPLRDQSIQTKLLLLSAASVGVALALSCAGLTWNKVRTLRKSKMEELTAQAGMLAFNSTGVLSFRDVHAAEQLLASLQSQPSVDFACLYDVDGRVMASYPAASGRNPIPPSPRQDDCRFNPSGQIELFRRILDRGEPVGALYLRANTHDLHRDLADFGVIVIAVILSSTVASLLLTTRLQRAISEPLQRLARTASKVTLAGDYSIRVEHESRDEVGALCAEFNRMLDRVEATDRALKEAHEELEERVLIRTKELKEEIEGRERIQTELVRAKDEAEAANRAKSDFLANMSHEIRTPMTAILGFADLLLGNLGDAAPPENVEAAQIIKQNGEHLLSIISDILDLSKVEAGKLAIQKTPMSPFQAISEIASLMRIRADAKGLALGVEFIGPIPERILTDPIRFRQILSNLVGNAIKFTEVGGVRLVARMKESDVGAAFCVDVIDTGIGIAAESLAQLFRPFTQADSSTSRKFGGTGLGLAISKRLAEMLGGSISVVSTPGWGSTFTLSIDPGPVDAARMLDAVSEAIQAKRPGAESPAASADRLDCRILLAEDGPDNRRLISFLLKKAGADVVTAENGQLAMEEVQATRSNSGTGQDPLPHEFDVILMDMQMPVMDGYEATRRLRADGYRGPILALTAHAMTEDRQKCLDAGCDDYLTKPIDRQRLIEIVAHWASRAGIPRTHRVEATAGER